MTLALFLHNFEWIKLELEERKSFAQDLTNLCIGVEGLLGISATLFIVNLFCVKHQFDWQSLLDKSWCSLNFFMRLQKNDMDE